MALNTTGSRGGYITYTGGGRGMPGDAQASSQKGGYFGELYRADLSNWLKKQEEARKQYLSGEQELTTLKGEFAPTGALTQGQMKLVEDEGRRAAAMAQAEAAATGMSSGSMAAGMKSRVARDVAAGKVGVEQNRVQNLASIVQNLAAMRQGEAGRLGATVNPYTGDYMSAINQSEATAAGVSTAAANRSSALAQQAMQNAASLQAAKMEDATRRYAIDTSAKLDAAKIAADSQYQIPRITL